MSENHHRQPTKTRRQRGPLRSWIAPPFERLLEEALADVDSVLDLGCGENSPLGRFRRKYAYSMGVDLFPLALKRSRAADIHSDYRLMDVLDIAQEFEPGSFDAVVAFDLIEHLNEADGLRLLTMMETVARRRIVILTPNGFLPQSATGGNPLQIHRSGWSARRMRELGYDVHGASGLRTLRAGKGSTRWRPARFWGLISDLTQPIVYRFPSLAFHVVCVKRLEDGERRAADSV
jgi:SAM-dependent methyltransferase